MVVNLGADGERSEGGGSEIPLHTSLLEEQARQSQQRRASALEAATAGELKTLEAALHRGESIGLLMDIFEQVRNEPGRCHLSQDGLSGHLGCPPQ
jgi:hypothetical protein